jgi:hypothetical protein
VLLSLALLLVILFFRQGLLGRREVSWDFLNRPLRPGRRP